MRPTSRRRSSRWRRAPCCSISPSPARGWWPWASAATCCSPTIRAPAGARRRACRRASCSPRCSSPTREYGWAVGHDETILNSVGRRRNLDAHALRARSAAAAAGSVVREPGQRHRRRRLWRLLHHQRRRPHTGASAKFAPPAGAADAKRPRRRPPDEEDMAPDYHLNRIVGVGNRLYMAAEGGQLYRSDDRGASWRALPSPYEGSFFGLVPIRGEGLLAFGLRGHLYRSADAGETWTRAGVAHRRDAHRRRRRSTICASSSAGWPA